MPGLASGNAALASFLPLVHMFLMCFCLIYRCVLFFRYAKPISVARCVLEHASLSMLVGSGAAEFAQQQGFQMEDNDSLLTEETRRAFQVWMWSIDRQE